MNKLSVFLLLSATSLLSAQEGSYSYYCYFHDDPIQSGFFTDGYYCGGPFRVNGSVILTSSSSGRNNDPYFYSFTLSSDYYIYGPSSSGPHVTVPQYDKLWIEPYEMMEQGPPWFNLGAEPLPFGADQVDWEVVKQKAANDGLYLTSAEVPNGSRILLEDGQISIKASIGDTPVVYSLAGLDEPVVWIENNSGENFYLKGNPGSQGFSESLTIGTQGTICFSGPLEYNGDDAGMLGIISIHGDGLIADVPEIDWFPPYDIETDESFVYSASILILEGQFAAENYTQPVPQVDFTLSGGIQMQSEGYTGTPTSGFNLCLEYDERLLNQSPPWYPGYDISGVEEASEPSELILNASCNPVSSCVTITSSEQSIFRVFSSSGRLVDSSETVTHWAWNTASLPAGVYLVNAEGEGDQTSSMRLVKL